MEVHVSLVGRKHLADQVRKQLAEHIAGGSVRPGTPLPSTRELAARLEISRNTVVAAYERLMADGLVESRAGIGYLVRARPKRVTQPRSRSAASAPQPAKVWRSIDDQPDMSAATPAYDFRPGVPSAKHFPYARWRARLSDSVRPAALQHGVYTDPCGQLALREGIARHLALSRAVSVRAEDVVVTTGTQQAVDLIARAVLEPGDTVAMEDPGYHAVRALLVSHRAQVVGVPVDRDGLVVDALPDDTRLLYVTPSHQFPLGMSMSLDRRYALLTWAVRRNVVIIEDDYDSEYRYVGRPIEPLQSMDDSGRVLYVGSFSKILLPIFRLGFMVTTPSLAPAIARAKFVTDWHTNAVMQLALASFIADGSLAKYIRKMRNIYLERHRAVVDGLVNDFADVLEPIPSAVGLHVAALPPGVPCTGWDEGVARRAQHLGVAINYLSQFASHRPDQGIVIGYGNIERDRIEDGLQLLRRAVTGVQRR